ncbi:MAG: hypothetical protein ABW168_28845 [Sedimenticola sp.]
MAEQLLDPSWFRVADLKPRLRSHVRVQRHHYRGKRWYVIQDAGSGRYHRFTPLAYQLIGLMNGVRTLGRIWEVAARELGDDVPTQGETLRLLHQLYDADVLQTDMPADTAERLRRFDKERSKRRLQHLKSPLSIRIPLLDPERFLTSTCWLVQPLFSWFGAMLWLLVVGIGGTLAIIHWPELAEDTSGRLLAPQNLLLMWLAFPVVKSLHELGHAYAVKYWGGEVHQIGIMFLVFMPVPYVDASAAAAFRDKRKRALVGAMGILVELFVAALAMMVWLAVEPGIVKALAYNVMVISGISTVLFNGNPLLRFDAYYILADLVEIPNLSSRANKYLFYLIKRYAFGLKELQSPANAPGEEGWFLFYSPGSFIYRMIIFSTIIIFVAGEFFFIGVLMAIWAAFSLFVQPVYKGGKYLMSNAELARQRSRALVVSAASLIFISIIIFVAPVPLSTVAEGVIWAPKGSQLRAEASGFVARIHLQSGDSVEAGDLVITLEDSLLQPDLDIQLGELSALEARYDQARRDDRVRAGIVQEQIDGVKARIDRKREQIRNLEVKASRTGVLVLPGAKDLPQRYLQQGELLGYITAEGDTTVRTVVTQDEVDLVRNRTGRVDLRSEQNFERVIGAKIAREVPSASLKLPSVALGTMGGGRIAIDPLDSEGEQALEKVFQFDLVAANSLKEGIGSRIYVRFDHGWEPIGWAWFRALRRLLLRHFDV